MIENSIEKHFVNRVLDFAITHGMFKAHGKYIIGLSGGGDSVAMLHVLKVLSEHLNFHMEAVHCNFRLRGDESMRDENFCKVLCERMHMPLHLFHFDTKEYAAAHHVSIEMAARDLRYKCFEQLRQDIGADGICVAHHRDDSVETVLLNLVRGTGIRGLRGIQPVSGFVMRPLLAQSRKDIIDYLHAINQDYVTDSTNLINDVKRNKIRLDVIPLLQCLNPSVQRSIFETSLRVNEALKIYDDTIKNNLKQVIESDTGRNEISAPIKVPIEKLESMPSLESVLFAILEPRGYKPAQINQIATALQRRSGYFCSKTHELVFDRNHIIIQPINYKISHKTMRIPEEGRYIYDEYNVFTVEIVDYDSNINLKQGNNCVFVDGSKLAFPLYIRPIRVSDRFQPFGMNHYKLLSDYLTNVKCPLFEKRRKIVVTNANDDIVWLVGERMDNRFRLNVHTKHILKLTRVVF